MLSSKEVRHPTHGKDLKVKSTLLSKLDFLCAMFDIARSGWEGFIDLCVPLPFGFVFSLQYITVATIDIQSQWHPTLEIFKQNFLSRRSQLSPWLGHIKCILWWQVWNTKWLHFINLTLVPPHPGDQRVEWSPRTGQGKLLHLKD